MEHVKICPACGAEFVAGTDKQIYCCVKHAKRAYRAKCRAKMLADMAEQKKTGKKPEVIEHRCEWCDKKLPKVGDKKRFCNDACKKAFVQYINELNRWSKKPQKKPRKITFCSACGIRRAGESGFCPLCEREQSYV